MKMNFKKGNGIVGLIIIIAIIWFVSSLFSSDNSSNSYNSSYSGYSDSSSYDDSYNYDSEENYHAGFSGTETMEACNNDTGNCYDLDIDSDGENIERINFPNGGWRDVDYSDCDSGYCTVEDEDGTEWELQY